MSILNGLVNWRFNIDLKLTLLLFMIIWKKKTFLRSLYADLNWSFVQL